MSITLTEIDCPIHTPNRLFIHSLASKLRQFLQARRHDR